MSKRKKRNPSPVPAAEPTLPIRTVALVGHQGAGKTTLAEGLLEAGGAVRVRGAVEDGTALLDHDPEEKRRRLTLFNGYGWIEWPDTLIQTIDAPGTQARAGEHFLQFLTGLGSRLDRGVGGEGSFAHRR